MRRNLPKKNDWCLQWAIKDVCRSYSAKNAIKILQIEKEFFDCLVQQNNEVLENIREGKQGDIGEITCLVFCFIAEILENNS